MRVSFELEVKHNGFKTAGRELETLLSQIVRKSAFDIEARAKAAAPVDTGAMRASIYTATSTSSGYARSMAAARSALGRRAYRENRGRHNSAEVSQAGAAVARSEATFFEPHKPKDPLEALVAVGVEYGLYVEFGTVKMAGRPFFGPAFAGVKPKFEQAIKQALEQAVR